MGLYCQTCLTKTPPVPYQTTDNNIQIEVSGLSKAIIMAHISFDSWKVAGYPCGSL